EELKGIAERVAEISEKAKEIHVVYNNNASDYAPRAASRFREILEQQYPEFDFGPQSDHAENPSTLFENQTRRGSNLRHAGKG
ncbi:MAG TPA: DUF72 domain-containing protein, partial [Verrucomicrobiae bacterium]